MRRTELGRLEQCLLPLNHQLRRDLPHRGLGRSDEIFEPDPQHVAACRISPNHAAVVVAELPQVARHRISGLELLHVTLERGGRNLFVPLA